MMTATVQTANTNQEVLKAYNEILDLVSKRNEEANDAFNKAKGDAIIDLTTGDPTYAIKNRMKHVVNTQTRLLLWNRLQKVVSKVAEIENVDDYTRLVLLQERIEKYIERGQNELTGNFRLPSSSDHIERGVESIQLEAKFEFFFRDYFTGVSEIIFHLKLAFDRIEKTARANNEPAPAANLAERVTSTTRWQQNEFLTVEVEPFYNRVKVIVSVSEIEKAIYRFDVNPMTCKVKLDNFAKENRESKRHQKWTYTPIWDGEVRMIRGVETNPQEGRKEIHLDSLIEEVVMRAAAMITGVRPTEVG